MDEQQYLCTKILFCGHKRFLICDGICDKAWGNTHRPREMLNPEDEDDFVLFRDGELGTAPEKPGTSEGGDGKPLDKVHNKWCARERERSCLVDVTTLDFSQRVYNLDPVFG